MEISNELNIKIENLEAKLEALDQVATSLLAVLEQAKSYKVSPSSLSTTKRLTLIGTGLFKPEEQEKLVLALEQVVGQFTVTNHRHTSRSFSRTMKLQ